MSVEDTQRTMNAYVQDLLNGGPYKRHFSDDVVVSLRAPTKEPKAQTTPKPG